MTSSFAKRYKQDEEFRERHRQYNNERVVCECGVETSRNNLNVHRKSEKHKKRMDDKKNINERDVLESQIRVLHEEIVSLTEQLDHADDDELDLIKKRIKKRRDKITLIKDQLYEI